MAALRVKIDCARRRSGQTLLAERQRQHRDGGRHQEPHRLSGAHSAARRRGVEPRRRAAPRQQNLDPDLARSLWTAIIEWSIAYEERLMKRNIGREEMDHA